MKTKLYNKNCYWFIFVSFIIIHGEMIFNKLSWHDDINRVYTGWHEALPHGRWLYHLWDLFVSSVSGAESVPVIAGIVVATCISAFACLLFFTFEITNSIEQKALGLALCSIPAVAGHLGYIGTAGGNFMGFLLCAIGAFITCEAIHKQQMKLYFAGIILFACSLGEYQCYFASYLTLLLVYFTNFVISRNISNRDFLINIAKYILNVILGLILYLIILQFFLHVNNVMLMKYAGTDTYGIVSASDYLKRIIFAYRAFFNPFITGTANMFPFHWRGWYFILLSIIFTLSTLFVISSVKKSNKQKIFQFLILLFLLPCALNFNFVLYNTKSVHSLHMYHLCLIFIYPIILYKNIFLSIDGSVPFDIYLNKLKKIFHCIVIVTIVIFDILYIRYDNYCYMVGELKISQAKSYFTTLSTRITSVNGYDISYPVAFISERNKFNSIDRVKHYYDVPVTNPYSYNIINGHRVHWTAFMKNWCGYKPVIADEKKFKNHKIVKQMPCYPNDGSIRIINKTIVVKFK